MVESTGKLATGLVLLVVLWIGVYWLYEPKPAPISAGDGAKPVGVEGAFLPGDGVVRLASARTSEPAPAPPRETSATPGAPVSARILEPVKHNQPIAEPALVLGQADPAKREPLADAGNAPSRAAGSPLPHDASIAPRASVGETVLTPPQGPSASEPEGAPIKVIPPEMLKYAVQKGDTFEAISERFYGTREFASSVAKANPFTSPDRLREGRMINIPRDPNNIYGVPAPSGMTFDASIAAAAKPASATTSTPPAAALAKPEVPRSTLRPEEFPREYVVKSGDTLSGIAKKLYGDTKSASRIFEANRAKLRSPDDLREGQTLLIPPKEKLGG